ncbi:MAG: c-type cytochrome [Segetibacter sp.]|jgi:cytochrome c|nr:c-type cytochrome [Segetibacter sp.]
MKKASLLFFSLVICCATNYYSISQTKKPAAKSKAKSSAAPAKSSSSKAEIEQGKNLISKSDCLACHQVQVKVVGPAYSAVAEKYPSTEANIAKLSEKIIKGGSGVWGPIPMSPHPTIPVADAKKMAKYILSLKSK